MPLSNNHWTMETYRQRMTVEEWKKVLLSGNDHIVCKGGLRQLKAENLGYGVVEVFKVPIG